MPHDLDYESRLQAALNELLPHPTTAEVEQWLRDGMPVATADVLDRLMDETLNGLAQRGLL